MDPILLVKRGKVGFIISLEEGAVFDEIKRRGLANVMVRSWCPHKKLLADAKVKLFVADGILDTVLESIYYGKPLLGRPQDMD